MRAVSDNGDQAQGGGRRFAEHSGGRRFAERRLGGQRPGEALIEGGFGPRGAGYNPYARPKSRRRTVRVAAPLAVPIALGVTLGIILAVSSGGPTHVTQGNSGASSSSTSAPAHAPAAP